MKNLTKIKGDASYRKFFRQKNNQNTSIIVHAKKEKFKNLLIYDAINKILNKNKVLAPNLYEENYRKNYIEIEDFGNESSGRCDRFGLKIIVIGAILAIFVAFGDSFVFGRPLHGHRIT